MHLTWDQMIDPQNPFFTGTMWENIGPNGTATEARTSLAHGWASGPTPILTGYLLGVQPVNPGCPTSPWRGFRRPAMGRRRGPDTVRTDLRKVGEGRPPVLLTVAVPAPATAFIELPSRQRVPLARQFHATERTFGG